MLFRSSYWVVGNANLTNAFGQSAAVVAVAAAVGWSLEFRRWWQIPVLAALAGIGLLSHVSTGALLAATLGALAILYLLAPGRSSTQIQAGWSVLAAIVAGAALSMALYYGRPEFYPAYRSALAARAADGQAPAAGDRPAAVPTPGAGERALDAAVQSFQSLGWPLVILAAIGGVHVVSERAERRSGRLRLALIAWAAAYVVFMVFGVAAPGRVGQQRYALEFVARATYASSPAVLILAATGALWLWRRGAAGQRAFSALSVLLLAAAAIVAGREWVNWLR